MKLLHLRHWILAPCILGCLLFSQASQAFRSDIELIQKWEAKHEEDTQKPRKTGQAWELAEKGGELAAEGAGFFGPVYNAGGTIADKGEELGKVSNKAAKKLLRDSLKGGRENINDMARQFSKHAKRAGEALESFGQAGEIADDAGNLASGAGAMAGGDVVGMGQAGGNAALSGMAASLGGMALGELGAAAGMMAAGPPGGLVMGALGTVGGAIIGSIGYDKKIRPEVNRLADELEKARSDQWANEDIRQGRIRADLKITGLDQIPDPPESHAAASSITNAPVEVDPLRPHNMPESDARALRQMARLELARRQAAREAQQRAAERQASDQAKEQTSREERQMPSLQSLHGRASWLDRRSAQAQQALSQILYSGKANSPENLARIEQLLGELSGNKAEMDRILAVAHGESAGQDPELLGALVALAKGHPDPDSIRGFAEKLIEEERLAEQRRRESEQAEQGWGGGAQEEGQWGDGGYEQVSPAEQYISGIVAADSACEFGQALSLADKARAADPGHAWLNQNYDAIRLLAQREHAYRTAIQSAIANLNQGKVAESIGSLKSAMQNASSRCDQDQAVKSLLEDAKRIAKMEREDAIAQARLEGQRSTSERNRERARFQQRQAEREQSAQDLQGALMGVLGAVGRAQSSPGTTVETHPESFDEYIRRRARENDEKYGELMRKHQQGNSFTAPRKETARSQSQRTSQPSQTGPSSTNWATEPWENTYDGDFGQSECDHLPPGIYEFGECFEHHEF